MENDSGAQDPCAPFLIISPSLDLFDRQFVVVDQIISLLSRESLFHLTGQQPVNGWSEPASVI